MTVPLSTIFGIVAAIALVVPTSMAARPVVELPEAREAYEVIVRFFDSHLGAPGT